MKLEWLFRAVAGVFIVDDRYLNGDHDKTGVLAASVSNAGAVRRLPEFISVIPVVASFPFTSPSLITAMGNSGNAQRLATISAKHAARDKALALASPYDSNTHDPFLQATASEIVENIASGKWTASQVLDAYMARAVVSQAKTNCITEVLFEDAKKQAKVLDEEFSRTGKLRGPLHGVPMSFKDQYEISGYDATIGFTHWANKPCTTDAFLVSQCRKAGAIIIVKTNVPQTMFAFECSNALWGRTTNPWGEKYTCGGSSGGEAALLAMDGSALGVGSDIGGSLRIPTSYCGIYAIKPSPDRVSSDGARGCNPGYEAIRVSYGPMGRSVRDCELFCRTVFGEQDHAHQTVPLPFRPVELPGKLKFGYYVSDTMVHISPANVRAVQETIDALRSQGHECVEFSPSLSKEAMSTFVALATADGYKRMLSTIKPDPKETSLFLSTLGPKLPGFVRLFIAWAAHTFYHDKPFHDLFSLARSKSVSEFVEYTDRRNKVTKAWYKEVWDKYGFDGIIAPVQSLPTIPHGGCAMLSPLAEATILYNVVDSPVGVVPVTRVEPTKDVLPAGFVPGAKGTSTILEKEMYTGPTPVYDPVAMAGIPVGVQIVGKKWEDEKVLAMMKVVDDALGTARGFGPGCWKAQ
ncbi:amidase signature domain-containing protein [Boletus edulis]|nr:amidase signature domain-containing protein [Boletus edulis]KAF8124826.1 amidase signature domain-containing protein [Boletus edulis]